MATRAYRRDSNGRFAGSGGGTKVTYGKAGGFANAGFRQRVAASRGNASPGKGPTGQKASAGRSMGATAGAKGRPPTRKAQKSRTSRVLTFAAKNPTLTASVVVYGGITGAGVYRQASQNIGYRASANRFNAKNQAYAATSRGLPGATRVAKSRRGTYKVTSLR